MAGPIGRLAPTPSAGLHVGNIFSCLVSWLVARRDNGSLVMRIEDLDRERTRQEHIESILRDLSILGLTWDNDALVYQSKREDAYVQALNALENMGLLYPCFCSRADLHAASAPHVGERYIYARACSQLSERERDDRREQGRRAATRIRVPSDSYTFSDRLQGQFSMNLEDECGDFIVRRSDGAFAYQLAVVVDDLAQNVTQIVRGYDLLDSTPQQLYLRKLLDPDASQPDYFHIPLLVDEAGRRLSKRDHDMQLTALLAHFGSTEAFIGHLAGLTGLLNSTDPVSLEYLLAHFSLDALRGKKQLVWLLP